MFKVQAVGTRRGREVVEVLRNDRLVCAASLPFIEWMQQRVPEHQLAPEQIALIQWDEDIQLTDSSSDSLPYNSKSAIQPSIDQYGKPRGRGSA